MIVLDTNVLVRLATQEPQSQWLLILDRLRHETSYILKTVLLETEWILRSLYERSATEIYHFFAYLLETKYFAFEDENIYY